MAQTKKNIVINQVGTPHSRFPVTSLMSSNPQNVNIGPVHGAVPPLSEVVSCTLSVPVCIRKNLDLWKALAEAGNVNMEFPKKLAFNFGLKLESFMQYRDLEPFVFENIRNAGHLVVVFFQGDYYVCRPVNRGFLDIRAEVIGENNIIRNSFVLGNSLIQQAIILGSVVQNSDILLTTLERSYAFNSRVANSHLAPLSAVRSSVIDGLTTKVPINIENLE